MVNPKGLYYDFQSTRTGDKPKEDKWVSNYLGNENSGEDSNLKQIQSSWSAYVDAMDEFRLCVEGVRDFLKNLNDGVSLRELLTKDIETTETDLKKEWMAFAEANKTSKDDMVQSMIQSIDFYLYVKYGNVSSFFTLMKDLKSYHKLRTLYENM